MKLSVDERIFSGGPQQDPAKPAFRPEYTMQRQIRSLAEDLLDVRVILKTSIIIYKRHLVNIVSGSVSK